MSTEKTEGSDLIRMRVQPPGLDPSQQWRFTSLFDPADGTIYVTGDTTGNELTCFLCASWDQTPVVMNEGHAYHPVLWIARNFPAVADIVQVIERRTREGLASEDLT